MRFVLINNITVGGIDSIHPYLPWNVLFLTDKNFHNLYLLLTIRRRREQTFAGITGFFFFYGSIIQI